MTPMTPMTSVLLLLAVLQSPDELERHRNLGKAYYERGEYALAAEELEAVLGYDSARGRDYFNAGMAYLQNQQSDRALAAFETARQMEPGLIEVDFGLGVLAKRAQRYPVARESFQRVVARDPEDPCTWFNLGAVSFSMDRLDEAEAAFRRVLEMGHGRARNFYVSALFRYASLLARRGASEEAQRYFSEFESLRRDTPNVSLTPTALENGRYGRVEVPPAVEPGAVAEKGELVLEVEEELPTDPCPGRSAVALGDYDADGSLDLFVPSLCGRDRLFRTGEDGELEDVTEETGLSDSRGSRGALFIDYESSGKVGLYTFSEGAHRLYRGDGARFVEVSGAAGLSTVTPPESAVAVDLDNDSQLDLLLGGPGARLDVLRNDGDGRFTVVDSLDPGGEVRGLAAADFDEDGFTDVFVELDSSEGLLLRNEGGQMGKLRPSSVASSVGRAGVARIDAIDFDADSWIDVVASDESGLELLWNRRGSLEAFPGTLPRGAGPFSSMDVDGDGSIDYLASGANGKLSILSYARERRFTARTGSVPAGIQSLVAAFDLQGDGKLRAVATADDGKLRLLRLRVTGPETEPAPRFVRLALEGKRTNRQGVGAVVELKAGRFYRKTIYPGHPVTLYTGTRDHLDVVRVTWTNGVIQNLLDVETGKPLRIVEEERQTSSCPFVYVWDGEGFRFLTDVVGRAPLGEILPDGSLVLPNPEDYVRIPPGGMQERDGELVFQLTEELRELAYLDHVELLAIDHPKGLEIFTNERFSGPPFEPFRLYSVRSQNPPSKASNEKGEDVLAAVRRADGETVSGFSRHRVSGFAEEHALELVAPHLEEGEPTHLFLSGWVFWPSSSSMKALATNRSFAPRPPELQVKDQDGNWVTLVEDMGLPSGIGRTLVVDLRDLRDLGGALSHGSGLRIVTNFAVYWDEAFFATPEPAADLRTSSVSLRAADLHFRGFSRVERDSDSRPERYHYDRLLDQAPWDAVEGAYTRYGDVAPLLSEADGAMVVLAPGDEVTLRFDPKNVSPPEGDFERDYVLHLTGWAKDQDPNTRFSRNVEPLPRDASPLGRSYATRRAPPLVPPLAPPSALREPQP